MPHRNFLKNIKIVGAMLVSREGDILDYSLNNLLKWCDWVLLMQDNEDDYTRKKIEGYKRQYPNRIRVANSGFPRATKKQEESNRGLFHRFKKIQGEVRETVFQYMRDRLEEGEKVDVLIFPDADELYTDYLPTVLKKFWKMKDKRGLTFKPIDVYGNFFHLRGRSMAGHTRILKFKPDITALPYRTLCNYRPLTRADRITQNRVAVHLAALTTDKRNWREKHWKPTPNQDEPLWKLERDVRTMKPDEILKVMEGRPHTTVKEYHNYYGK